MFPFVLIQIKAEQEKKKRQKWEEEEREREAREKEERDAREEREREEKEEREREEAAIRVATPPQFNFRSIDQSLEEREREEQERRKKEEQRVQREKEAKFELERKRIVSCRKVWRNKRKKKKVYNAISSEFHKNDICDTCMNQYHESFKISKLGQMHNQDLKAKISNKF